MVVVLTFIRIIKYFILGIIQGVTEVLPISSSGHVEIAKNLMAIDFCDGIIFLIIVNTGSLLVFLMIYFKRLVHLTKSFFLFIFKKEKREDNRENFIYLMKIILATIPAGLIGLLLEKTIDNFMVDYALLMVGIGLLLTATVLFYITRFEPFTSKNNHISWKDAALIGLAQSVALIPGVSRSGMTTSTAIKRGTSIDSALDFSFIMYIPISLASLTLLVVKLMNGQTSIMSEGNSTIFLYIFAFVGAFVATYIAYKLIFSIFRSGKLKYFSYYCFAASLLAIILFIF